MHVGGKLSLEWVRWALLAAIVLLAAAGDVRSRRIPNLLTLPGLVLGLLLGALAAGWMGFWQSLLGAAAGLGLLFLPFALGGLGAGDVKLLAMVGAFGGPAFAFRSFLAAALIGGAASALLLWRAGRLGATLRVALWNTAALVSSALPFLPLRPLPTDAGGRGAAGEAGGEAPAASAAPAAATLPYGVAITLGTVAAWLWSWWRPGLPR
ncbi:MAG TPA: hypothetical protein GXX28_12345 [Firmicutes bacterium]|nr:hypothetical protein [Bacillota bacterium]